jgi:hypothetical protein
MDPPPAHVQVSSGRRVVPTELGITLIKGYQLIDPELCRPQVNTRTHTHMVMHPMFAISCSMDDDAIFNGQRFTCTHAESVMLTAVSLPPSPPLLCT